MRYGDLFTLFRYKNDECSEAHKQRSQKGYIAEFSKYDLLLMKIKTTPLLQHNNMIIYM